MVRYFLERYYNFIKKFFLIFSTLVRQVRYGSCPHLVQCGVLLSMYPLNGLVPLRSLRQLGDAQAISLGDWIAHTLSQDDFIRT